jgi:Putative zincin peptidase
MAALSFCMPARRSLPDGFVLGGTLYFRGNRRLWLTVTLLSLPWGLVSIFGIRALALLVRPQGWTFDSQQVSLPVIIATVVGLAAICVLTIVVHEIVHGLLLWAFTRTRPVFGFKGWYAYANAPGWYLSRWLMIAVLGAPLIMLPVLGLPLVAFLAAGPSLFVLLGLYINAVAATGDLYMIGIVLRVRGPVYFGDSPDHPRSGQAGSWYIAARRDS